MRKFPRGLQRGFLFSHTSRLVASTLRVGFLKGSGRSLPLSRRPRGFPAQAINKKIKIPRLLAARIFILANYVMPFQPNHVCRMMSANDQPRLDMLDAPDPFVSILNKHRRALLPLTR